MIEYDKIVSNLQWLIGLNISPGVAFVLGTRKQYKNILETISYLESLGVRYFSLETATVWEDDKCIGLDLVNFKYFIVGCAYILSKSFNGDLKYVNFPRELISSDFFFNKQGGVSCTDSVRALSPRGKVYLCRDHAANEESSIKKTI